MGHIVREWVTESTLSVNFDDFKEESRFWWTFKGIQIGLDSESLV